MDLETKRGTLALMGKVETAFPIDEAMIRKLETHFSAMLNKQVSLPPVLEPSVIGGIIVTIGDRVYDGSVRGQLNKLKEHILSD